MEAIRQTRKSTLSKNSNTRLRRAISWGMAAESQVDNDVEFIFYWIGLSGIYSTEEARRIGKSERQKRKDFFTKVCELDVENRIMEALIGTFNNVFNFAKNQFVHDNFWRYQNDEISEEEFEEKMGDDSQSVWKKIMTTKLNEKVETLDALFSLMAVLRNQIFHGSSTRNSDNNKDQLSQAVAILRKTVPIMVEIVLENDGVNWGMVQYPDINQPKND